MTCYHPFYKRQFIDNLQDIVDKIIDKEMKETRENKSLNDASRDMTLLIQSTRARTLMDIIEALNKGNMG